MFWARVRSAVLIGSSWLILGESVVGQEVNIRGDLVEYVAPIRFQSATARFGSEEIDFENAEPLLPQLPNLPKNSQIAELSGGFRSQEQGDRSPSNLWQKPFTTRRVATNANGTPAVDQPYAATGKLYFKNGFSSFVCSGVLVKPGLVLTAAHCVAPFGQSTFYTDFVFIPGKHFENEPHGRWEAASALVKDVWFNGTDTCAVAGIVCANDVAVIRLKAKSIGRSLYFAGDRDRANRFGAAVNDNVFNEFKEAMVTQLGYPVSHDSGLAMHETNSQSSQVAEFVDNNVIGSRQTGGSSGGPWIINHGYRGQITNSGGNSGARNLVVGVTSWGYTDNAVKILGASKLTHANAIKLIRAYCPIGATNRYCID